MNDVNNPQGYPVTAQPAYANKAYEAQQQQPGQYGMQMQAQPQNLPGGLEYLAHLDKIKVHQVFDVVEVLTGWERNNKYNICNEQEQQFMFAKEENDCCTRQCLGTLRPFEINISNMSGAVVMQLTRGLNCQGCCYPCCLQEMDICYPPGQRIATVKEMWTCMVPKYEILDVNNEVIFRIEGDCCYCKCCDDVVFRVTRPDGSPYGEVAKHWGGFREVCGQVNDFSVTFDRNEHPLNKAILMGATFLVDYMYFEYKNNK